MIAAGVGAAGVGAAGVGAAGAAGDFVPRIISNTADGFTDRADFK